MNPSVKAFFQCQPDEQQGYNTMWVSAINTPCVHNLYSILNNYGVQFDDNFDNWDNGNNNNDYRLRLDPSVGGVPHRRGQEEGEGGSKTKSGEVTARRRRILLLGCLLAKTTMAGINAAIPPLLMMNCVLDASRSTTPQATTGWRQKWRQVLGQ